MAKKQTLLGKVCITPRQSGLSAYSIFDLVVIQGRAYLSLKNDNVASVDDSTAWMKITENTYDIAVRYGFDGTEEEWLVSLSAASEEAAKKAKEVIEKCETATEEAKQAKESAEDAVTRLHTLSDHMPKIEGGTWWLWDEKEKEYYDSRMVAKGKDFTIKAYFKDLLELEAMVPKPEEGDHYGVGEEPPYDIYVYDPVNDKWVNTGPLQGAAGKSAYELWLEEGNTGTVSDFLDNLKGEKGEAFIYDDLSDEQKLELKGDTGDKGEPGEPGADGTSVTFTEKVNTATHYILEITDGSQRVETPNLKGKNGRDYECPTLSVVPEENTVSYLVDGEEIAFKIGQQARVLDPEEGEYVFYQLYDLFAGKAVWKEAGSGGRIKGEVVNINVTGNQSQPDTSLLHATITIGYADETVVFPWNGTQLVIEIPVNITYRVICSDVDGYATPAPQEYIALEGNTRNLTVEYHTTVTTLNVTSNQTAPNADLNGLKLTLKYTTPTLGEVTKELTYNSTALSQKIPTGIAYTLAGAGISGYNTPATLNRTAAGVTDSVSLHYTTERVTIHVSTDDGQAAVSSQTLTVTNTSTNAVLYSGAAGTGVVVKIPFGTPYKVSVNDLVKYNKPLDQTYTSGDASRTVSLVYERIRSAQITFDKSISDPENITGEVNSSIIAEILAKFRRCLVKKTAEGQVTIAYLRDDNSKYYEDGTAAVLTGSEGDVMVHFPEFYYKYEKVDDNKFRYHFALQKVDDTYIKVSESLLGAYEAYVTGNRPYSRSGQASTGNISQADWKMFASYRGQGYGIIDYEQHCVIAMMFFAKYGTRNSQAVLGVGVDSYTYLQGTSNATGMADTKNTTTGYATFLGIEAVHGGKYEWVDGVVIDNYVWKITNPETGTTRNITANQSSYNLWIREIAASTGPYFDVIPTEVSGSESTYYADRYLGNNVSGLVLARSYYSSNTDGGIAYTYAHNDSAYASASIGSRLAFRGEIRKAASVSEFKALSVQ